LAGEVEPWSASATPLGVSSISGVGDVAVVDEVSLAEAPACGEQTVMVVVVVVVVVVRQRLFIIVFHLPAKRNRSTMNPNSRAT